MPLRAVIALEISPVSSEIRIFTPGRFLTVNLRIFEEKKFEQGMSTKVDIGITQCGFVLEMRRTDPAAS